MAKNTKKATKATKAMTQDQALAAFRAAYEVAATSFAKQFGMDMADFIDTNILYQNWCDASSVDILDTDGAKRGTK
jgi:hypothetical protein